MGKAGIDNSRIAKASSLHARLVAQRDLASAAAGEDLAAMSSAIKQAKAANLLKSEVDKVENIFQQLQRAEGLKSVHAAQASPEVAKCLLDVQKLLESAIRTRDPAKLRASIQQARKVGMAPAEVLPAEQILEKIDARDSLCSAMAAKDIEALQSSIEIQHKLAWSPLGSRRRLRYERDWSHNMNWTVLLRTGTRMPFLWRLELESLQEYRSKILTKLRPF